MTTVLATSLVLIWVLCWFGMVAIWAPLAAGFGAGNSRRALLLHIGPALVCAWLTLAVGVPLTAAVGGFNWVTAILLAAACPAGMWLHRHRGAYKTRLQGMMRSFVMDAMALTVRRPRIDVRRWLPPIAAVSMLVLWPLVAGGRDVRLPVPADFDVLSRTRQILSGGGAVWDPLAAMAAVLTRISSTNPLYVASAMRIGLVTLTGFAIAILIVEIAGWSWTPAMLIAPLAFPLVMPLLPSAAWAVALSILTAATSFLLWLRTRRSREAWSALAALALAAGLLQPFIGNFGRLAQAGSSAYLEHPAAPRQALRLDSTASDIDWLLVAPPEQQLEIEKGRFLDLTRFVSRFRDRAGDPGFRFDLGADRIYVFVEEQPLDTGLTGADGEFVAAQPVSYRVPRERVRLARLARQICDDYRRTHARAGIIYDDGALRVYQIDR